VESTRGNSCAGGEEYFDVAVVGGGPAGLRAAEVAAQNGAKVAVFDAKASVGRKFLVAGRGGLNLTHAEDDALFVGRYRSSDDSAAEQSQETRERWKRLISVFGPKDLREWATGLGVETFVASTGRVYPRELKAAPLLRRWVARLRALGVSFRMRHRLVDFVSGDVVRLEFEREKGAYEGVPPAISDAAERAGFRNGLSESPEAGPRIAVQAGAAVLALGGASWPETGSDGGWVALLQRKGVSVEPLRPANCGWECRWPEEVVAACEGRPLKNVQVSAGGLSVRGELLVTRYGLEGGAIYALSRALSEMESPALQIDFKPDSTLESLVRRLGTARSNFLEEARLRWRLDETTYALLFGLSQKESFSTAENAARRVKGCPIQLIRPRPVAEAISTLGGVSFSSINERLMLVEESGVFVAGEMLDWEGPTGGYLLQGSFATGTQAGQNASERTGVRFNSRNIDAQDKRESPRS
jgi:predicted flavoprotein YhiN